MVRSPSIGYLIQNQYIKIELNGQSVLYQKYGDLAKSNISVWD